MADMNLREFILNALSKGASKEEIEEVLREADWSSEQIADGLASFLDVDFVVPVPTSKPPLLARDAFFYLVMFGTLYLSAFHVGSLLFQFVDLMFPDRLGINESEISDSIRSSIAALVVGFPLFIWVSYYLGRDISRQPVRRNSPVRNWLTYVTLFVAGCIVTGDIISLIYTFLSGGVTIHFLLKTIVVGGIAGAIFGYYLRSLHIDQNEVTTNEH